MRKRPPEGFWPSLAINTVLTTGLFVGALNDDGATIELQTHAYEEHISDIAPILFDDAAILDGLANVIHRP